MQYEWKTEDPKGKLGIPEELLATQQYRWTATPREVGLRGTAASYETILGGVRLLEVLVDTSERIGQTIMIKRVTFRAELLLLGAVGVIIFPFNSDEDETHGAENKTPRRG
jgi:hypothetical protein